MALRDLWRKLTRRREEDEELDPRPAGLDKLPGIDHFVQPPKPTDQDKPKH